LITRRQKWIIIGVLSVVLISSVIYLFLVKSKNNFGYIKNDSYYLLDQDLNKRIVYLHFEREGEKISGNLHNISAKENVYLEDVYEQKRALEIDPKGNSLGNNVVSGLVGESIEPVIEEEKITYKNKDSDRGLSFILVEKEEVDRQKKSLNKKIRKANKKKKESDRNMAKKSEEIKKKIVTFDEGGKKSRDFISKLSEVEEGLARIEESIEKNNVEPIKTKDKEKYCKENEVDVNCFLSDLLREELNDGGIFDEIEAEINKVKRLGEEVNEVRDFIIEHSLESEMIYGTDYFSDIKNEIKNKKDNIQKKKKEIEKKLGI